MIDAARWRRIEEVYDAALARLVEERAAFVADACGTDLTLREEVDSLLAHADTANGFLTRSPGTTAARALRQIGGTALMGHRLGAYEMVGRLGAGGMGEVYRARDTRLNRDVAIKILTNIEPTHDTLARFQREAHAIASLNHPHICALHDVGQQDGMNYLVMEYLEGQTLKEHLLETAPLPIGDVLKISSEIADGLVEAHRHGLVHRDVKPANIMLAKNGAKLLDFGLARRFESEDTTSEALTAVGAIFGTPSYMSPEQALGQPLDTRSDLFSLGVVLYEMATGRKPFEGANVIEIVDAVLHSDPAPAPDLNAGISSELGRVIARCLEKNRDHRYPSARALWTDLIELGRGPEPRIGSRRLPTRRHNLPLELTSFVGREREVSELSALLGETRLLTLSGSGGCGKTRLAIKVASSVVDRYADGVWFIELSPLSNPELVLSSVASTLNVQEAPERPLVQRVLDYLQNKRVLLVLDNCEHVVTAAATLVAAILSSCERVHVLVTSREPLGIPGERVSRVPSLSVPDPGIKEVADAPQYEAVRLFLERAQAVSPLALDQHEVERVVDICRRLDGIPLALEMAAARLDILSLDQIAARLTDRFALLAGTRKNVLRRQQTLRSTVDWSHDLLSPEEKSLFRRLAVFAGSFSLEAVEAVCAAEDLKSEEILGVLSRLVDKSMVAVTRTNLGVRYRLLETLREYATDKLRTSADGRRTRRTHVDFFLAMAERLGPEFRIGRSSEARITASAIDQLESDHQNLLAALQWCNDQRSGSRTALRIAVALWLFWETRCYDRLAKEQLVRALDRDRGRSPVPLRIEALNAAGHFLATTGELGAAQHAHEDSLRLAKETEDPRTIGDALRWLGIVAWRQDRYEEAEAIQRQALEIGRKHGFERLTAFALNHLAALAFARDDYDLAEACWRESDEHFRSSYDVSLSNYAVLAYDRGDYAKAESLALQALTIARETGRTSDVVSGLFLLGFLVGDNDLERSRMLYEEGLAIARDVGDKYAIATALSELGSIACAQGDYDTAKDLARQGPESLKELHQDQSERAAACLALQSQVALDWGDLERAGKLCQEGLSFALPKRWREHLFKQLGWARLAQGDVAAARSAFEESLALAQTRRIVGVAESTLGLGFVAMLDGRVRDAHVQFESSLSLYERVRNTSGVVNALLACGDANLLEGDDTHASASYLRSLGMARQMGVQKAVARALRGVGIVASRQGRPDLATRCLAAGTALLEAIHCTVPPFQSVGYEAAVDVARTELGVEKFQTTWVASRTPSSGEIDELIRECAQSAAKG
jgi:non-specific serine/threonine protein kinase